MTDEPALVVDVERSRAVLGDAYAGAVRFAELLSEHGEERGLIGPRELPRLWVRHIVNSAAVGRFLPTSGTVADVGTGAGLPGVVLALMRPDLEFHLVEPMERRIAWLAEVGAELDLDNVTLHRAQAQELHGRLSVDAVTARAVAALTRLVAWTLPLLRPGGALLAQKGERARIELDEARTALAPFHVERSVVHDVDVFDDGDITRVVEVRVS